jgi:peptide subunit release factor 1 (eRF1)
MQTLLKQLKDNRDELCVTLIVNTHRTHPENEKDELALKNLMKKAESRLVELLDKKGAAPYLEKLQQLAEKNDHRHNLESLILFVSNSIAEAVKLPISVTNRVIIDTTFATRDLIRAEHEQEAYYLLVLSKNEARLIEALNDTVVSEIKGDFPHKNETLFNTSKHDRHTAGADEKMIKEFFNRTDKLVQKAIKDHRLPVFVVADERNFTHFMEVADQKDRYVSRVIKQRGDEEAAAHHLVKSAWADVHAYNREKNARRIEDFQKAVSSGKVLSDPGEIWKAIIEGRGQTLFVKKGLFKPAVILENGIKIVAENEKTEPNVIEDIIDEMIEHNLNYGGDTVFIEDDSLEKHQGLALVTRY